jgi:hypothetical protein
VQAWLCSCRCPRCQKCGVAFAGPQVIPDHHRANLRAYAVTLSHITAGAGGFRLVGQVVDPCADSLVFGLG